MRLAWIPNAICFARIALIVPSVVTLLAGHYDLTLLLFAVAAVSDALDGWLAKRFGWTSRLGKILDPIADKLLLVSVFATLAWLRLVPAWFVAAVVLRDLLIVGGAAAYHFLIGYLEGHPTPVSKLNTLLQLSFVLAVIADRAWHLPAPLLTALGAAAFLTTVVSGLDYVMTYARAAVRESARTASRS